MLLKIIATLAQCEIALSPIAIVLLWAIAHRDKDADEEFGKEGE